MSDIDATALEALENLNKSLRDIGIIMHLSEVKGPVFDKLEKTHLFSQLKPGKIFFHTEQAIVELAGNI